jgi:hypothetical protein
MHTKFWSEILKEKISLGRLRHTWEGNIKMGLKDRRA